MRVLLAWLHDILTATREDNLKNNQNNAQRRQL
jgi:hypothetical protein